MKKVVKLKECVEDPSNLSALLKMIGGSFGIACNASDFFAFACADSVTIDSMDLHWVLPIVAKYDWTGLDACMAYVAKLTPIGPHLTDEYKKAYAEIEALSPEVHSEY